MSDFQNDEIKTTDEIAEMFKVSRVKVTEMFHKGDFPNAFQWGRSIRIPLSDALALKKQPFKRNA